MDDTFQFQTGMRVTCIDDQDVESLVQKNKFYVVRSVSHRGALVRVQGVPASLASNRFALVTSSPATPALELINASGE